MENENFKPNFLHMPREVAFDKAIQPLDKIIYSVIFWFEQLKDGRCFASNKTIAELCSSSSGAVANSLVRLRDAGHILCVYDNDGNRKEIKTSKYNSTSPSSFSEGGVHHLMNRSTNNRSNILSETEEKLTEVERSQIEELYVGYLIKFRVNPDDWMYADSDDRRNDLVNQAKKTYRLTPKRRNKLQTRLHDAGYDMVKKAIINCSGSSWHRGDDPKSGGWYAHLDWICNSYERVEDWATRNED